MNKNKVEKIINKQIQQNILKNIYGEEFAALVFSDDIKELINLLKINLFTKKEVEDLLTSITNSFLKKLSDYNQYLQFNKEQHKKLECIYKQLYLDIKNEDNYQILQEKHYFRIRNFLIECNPLYSTLDASSKKIHTYCCEEYSAKFQMEILNIDEINEPILDIGCGYHGNLVTWLRVKDKEAYGIDRYCINEDYLFNLDWLEFSYDKEKWGTVISNMALTNHIRHNYYLNNDIKKYLDVYYKVLNSLKKGGIFYYAPSLPFIEKNLDNNKYDIKVEKIDKFNSRTTIKKIIKKV